MVLKGNEEIHSEEEAVTEAENRAKAVFEIVENGSDRMKAFFTLPPMQIVHKMYLSVYEWRQWRFAVTQKWVEMGYIDLLADGLADCVNSREVPTLNMPVAIEILYSFMTLLTDCSANVCRILLEKGTIGTTLMVNIKSPNNDDDKSTAHFQSLNMSIIHNIAKLPESKEQFEAANAAELIKPYFASTSEKMQISAISAVACLLSDSPSSTALLDENHIIPKLVKCLDKSLNASQSNIENDHSYAGFSAEELVESLAILAVNDDNKQKIAQSGAIPLLVQMLESKVEIESSRAVDCLWALSFNEDIRKEIVAFDKCVETLENIASASHDTALKDKTSKAADFIKKGQEGMQSSAVVTGSSKGSHIFLSYNWKHQDTVLKIRQRLQDKGYTTWMDVDQMHGSTLESMAKAVEDAFLVLICYSENYKQSNMCRTEAEYVFRLGRPFVPVNMQYHYQPTGWLGIIVGARLYVDFSLHKHELGVAFPRLFKEINNMLSGPDKEGENLVKNDNAPVPSHEGGSIMTGSLRSSHSAGVCECCKMMERLVVDLVNSEASNSNTGVAPSFSPEREKSVRQWTDTAVVDWLKSEQLPNISLPNFDGPALIGLYHMKRSAPQSYYSSMLELVNGSFADCVRLTAAVQNLLSG